MFDLLIYIISFLMSSIHVFGLKFFYPSFNLYYLHSPSPLPEWLADGAAF